MNVQKNAITVAWGFVISLIVAAAGITAGFIFALDLLNEQAIAANHAKIDNELAEQEISKLKNLKTYLEQNKATVDRASEVVAASQAYTYQNQGIADLNTFASRVGVKILGIDFPDTSKQTSKKQASSITGVKRIPIIVRLEGPVPYVSYIRFLKSIEQNLTKMQITSVSMVPDAKDPSKLVSPSIDIEVYIR
jgi:hypothetical protein